MPSRATAGVTAMINANNVKMQKNILLTNNFTSPGHLVE
ncbi:hypothetical protein DCCM_0967 [Desulfocucumis palustris]|uniref:Uncharacterized protein n=1 Tax=Desulfocucumis palustris TaxID=1898651 RepID=A0A2L2XFX3_9FIRM|nr:hypothetical protein DCCM_0967 [Desulfocucumis palustris]